MSHDTQAFMDEWECPNCGEVWANKSAKWNYGDHSKCSLCCNDYV